MLSIIKINIKKVEILRLLKNQKARQSTHKALMGLSVFLKETTLIPPQDESIITHLSSFHYVLHSCLSFLESFTFFFFKILFLERGEGREKGRETAMCGCLSHASLTGDLAHSPGMCPDWESNQGPFGLQASAQSTELHQPGWNLSLLFTNVLSSPLSLKGGAGRELSTPLFQKQTSLAPPALDCQISENSVINFQTHFST